MTQQDKQNRPSETASVAEKQQQHVPMNSGAGAEETESISLVQILIGLMAATAFGLSLWNTFKPSEKSIHIIDLAGISMNYQQQARNQGLQDGITEQQRSAILANYQAKMNTLQQVIEEKVRECGCNIFVKSALVGRYENVIDLTGDVMAELDKRIPASAVVTSPNQPQTGSIPTVTPPQTLPDEGKGTAVNPQ
ncbi:hypothetical protein CRG49_008795 [Neisseria sp. N95_16]|uniref:Uncharacterized protein n=1 Tax=Neisseria brasiliensis TaxID=2666100 RepID=A0A7X2KZ42_9NEIS|nr:MULTISPECIES: hypothetical protein [Neisseria]MRN39286.1 hypothetical protein [Neisseria brasiliensis]PJO09200.1 hypothetical protein CRG49_008795 [Neisseria sp. N95_16]